MIFLLLSDIVVHGDGDMKIQVCHGCHGCHNLIQSTQQRSGGKHYHPHFRDQKTQLLKGKIVCPTLSSGKVAGRSVSFPNLGYFQRISLLASLAAQFHGFPAPKT